MIGLPSSESTACQGVVCSVSGNDTECAGRTSSAVRQIIISADARGNSTVGTLNDRAGERAIKNCGRAIMSPINHGRPVKFCRRPAKRGARDRGTLPSPQVTGGGQKQLFIHSRGNRHEY